jgi:LuxR family maltose regulon positive regulatory protein
MALRFQQKLIIPSSARRLVERTQLQAQLDQAITTKRVVSLAAPAGWGKTTVLAQWASSGSLPAAWYTLDAADRDPQLFLDYLLHTIAAFVPGADTIVTRLATTSPNGLPELFHATALAISAARRPFVLVFDDFHLIEEDPPPPLPGTALIFDLLASIAEYATCCHLVLASRTLPALHGLVRMAAQQRAAVFDYTALQLTTAEVQQLAGMCYALTLSDETADRLTLDLGGWVTGIVLSLDQALTESAVNGPSSAVMTNGLLAADNVKPYYHAPQQHAPLIQADIAQVYAYFAEQIIAPLPAELKRFLEDTSVLEDLAPQRCDALRGTGDAALFLDEIKRRGLFVSSRAGWLSYHSLFRDFLRARLARDPQRHRALLRRAGDHYAEEEDLERALDCYLAAGARDQAIALLRAASPRFRQRSRQTTLLACIERLGSDGADGVALPADLLLAQARVFGDLALWERAELALQLAGTIGDDETRWEAAILQANLLSLQGDLARARASIDEVPAAALPQRLQIAYHITAGQVLLLVDEISAGITALEQARAFTTSSAEMADDPGALADIYDNLGWAYAMQGDRPTALRYLKRADACWQSCGNSGRRALTLNNLGMLAMEEGRYAEARVACETGLLIARQTARRREETLILCSMGELDILEGDLEPAVARFTEAHALAVRMDVHGSIEGAAVGALWAVALQGDAALGQAWLDVASASFTPATAEVRGRRALGQSMVLLLQPRPKLVEIADLLAEATAVEVYLGAPERAYMALLRAIVIFERAGWPRAVAEWESFVSRAAGLPEALLPRFAALHQGIVEAAAGNSPLAQRMLESLRQPAPTRWLVTALGSFVCQVDGAPCDLSPLHRALLVRLLDAGPQGLAVERLWESVWGESELSMAALHQALRRLRVQTGLAVAAREGYCTIRTPWEAIDYDVRSFEQALDTPTNREAVQRAMALYRGDFLPGAPLSASLWIETRRAHLQQRYLDALEQLARVVECDAPHMAIHYYQQVLQIDGCREQTAAQLMRLAARFGNRSLVAATFEHLKGALRTLGAAPEPSTTALYQQLH